MTSTRCWLLAFGIMLIAGCGGGSTAFDSTPGGGGPDDGGAVSDGTGGSTTDPGDDGDSNSTPTLELPVLVQEVLSASQAGINRLARVATFGLPFARSQGVTVNPETGRPDLAVAGSARWQFTVLDLWPDGTVKWGLVDLLTDVAAGQISSHIVTDGAGASAGADLAAIVGDEVQIDTGPLQVSLSTSAFDLFETVTVDGVPLVTPSSEAGLAATSVTGAPLSPGADTVVEIERNGPACAVVTAKGSLVDAGAAPQAWFTCRLVFRAASRSVEATLTVRNASITKPEHAQLGSLGLAVDLDTGATPLVSVSTHAGAPTHEQELGASEVCEFYMAQTSASVTDITSDHYLPHIPKQPGSQTELVDQGYRIAVDGVDVHSLGTKGQFPSYPFVDLTGANGGVTIAIHHLTQLWPGSLSARGDGLVSVGAFPEMPDTPYTFVWQQHESRSAVFSFHRLAPADPGVTTIELDHPLSGRFADYAQYDLAGVFPYRLVSVAETQQVLTALGINHTIAPGNGNLTVTRYLDTHTTGGPNNYPAIQTNLATMWLRHGLGGYWLAAIDLATYKSEWQIKRSDDFVDDGADVPATNNALPHSDRFESDDEHRYREGIILAWYLTGDPRFRDAIYDEAEVLKHITVWEHERSMYRTLTAMAYVIEFTGDEELRDDDLIPRLQYITQTGPIDVCVDTSGNGWEGPPLPPGALLPGDRRYYVWSGDNNAEKLPGENFQTRGFITAEFGPTGYWHASRVLDANDPAQQPMHDACVSRMLDLAWFTREELYHYVAGGTDPNDWRLAYSYGVCGHDVVIIDNIDFHPILVGMTRTYQQLVDIDLPTGLAFLDTGAQQLKAAKFHNHLDFLLYRLDCQDFFSVWLDVHGP